MYCTGFECVHATYDIIIINTVLLYCACVDKIKYPLIHSFIQLFANFKQFCCASERTETADFAHYTVRLGRTLASASVLRSSMPSTVKWRLTSTEPFHGRSTTTLAKYWTRPYGWSSKDAGRYIGRRTLNG